MKQILSMIILFLLIISPIHTIHAQSYDFYYASSFMVNDHFEWDMYSAEYSIENDTKISSKTHTNISVTLFKSIAGVQATPITFFSDYMQFNLNSTQLVAFSDYFYYGWNTSIGVQFPLIYPAYRLNGTNYLDNVAKDPEFKATNYNVSYYGVFVTFTLHTQYRGHLNDTTFYNNTYTYESQTGLLVKSQSQYVHNFSTTEKFQIISINSTINIKSVPQGFQTEYTTHTSQTDQNSNLRSVDYNIFGFVEILVPVFLVGVSTKYMRSKS